MLFLPLTWLALAIPALSAQQPGSFAIVGQTLVSAMMVSPYRTSVQYPSLIDNSCSSVAPIRSTLLIRWRGTPPKPALIPLGLQFGARFSILYSASLSIYASSNVE